MNKLGLEYKSIRNPSNLVRGMNPEEFKKWLSIQLEGYDHLTSLKGALEAFEQEELYEYCMLIKREIDKYEKV